MKPETFSALVPFAGFYYSLHSELVESEEERLFEDDEGNSLSHLADYFFRDADYQQVYDAYAKLYVEKLSEHLGISLQWEEMVKPKYYNFQTDRLFATISRTDLAKILWKVRGKKLADKVREMFTSRDGFISHYENSVGCWGRIHTWDHNQIGAVLAAYVDEDDEIEVRDRLAEDSEVTGLLVDSAGPLGQSALWVMEKRYNG
jgi:hypothetical protein